MKWHTLMRPFPSLAFSKQNDEVFRRLKCKRSFFLNTIRKTRQGKGNERKNLFCFTFFLPVARVFRADRKGNKPSFLSSFSFFSFPPLNFKIKSLTFYLPSLKNLILQYPFGFDRKLRTQALEIMSFVNPLKTG